MKIRKMKSFLAIALAVALVFSTNVTPASAAKKKSSKVKVSSVKVVSPASSKKIAYVAKGKTIKLTTTVKVKPNKKANKGVTYKSANTKIATVTKKGVVKGKKVGTTKITVKSKKNSKKKATIKIKVVKNAVKKVTLNKKDAVLGVGKSVKLKATVKAAKKSSYKGVKWTTSNKKVATVKKGTVKGIKAGTAKITATALDGSKKKATCKVVVGTSISSVGVVNPLKSRYSDVISVKLDSAQILSKKDFQVKLKAYSDGKFVKEAPVEYVFTTDNVNYKLYLKNDEVVVGNYVQVTVSALTGIKTAETQFKSEVEDYDVTVTGEVGESVSRSVSDSLRGYSAANIESGSLPNGITYNAKTSAFGGIAKSVANNQKVTFKVTNEFDETQKVNVNFLIGDENNKVVESKTVGVKTGDKVYSHQSVYEEIYVAGGQGSNKVELTDDCGGKFELGSVYSDSFYVTTKDDAELNSGTYNVKYKVTDTENTAISVEGTLTVVVSETVPVTVVLRNTNAAGNPSIKFYNHDREDYISGYDFKTVTDNDLKTISAYLPTGNYTIYYSKYGVNQVLDKYYGINGATTLSYDLPTCGDIKLNVTDRNGAALNKDYVARIYRAEELAEDAGATQDGSTWAEERYDSVKGDWVYTGSATFDKVLPGKYVIKIFVDGKEVANQTEVTIGNTDAVVNIQTTEINQ